MGVGRRVGRGDRRGRPQLDRPPPGRHGPDRVGRHRRHRHDVSFASGLQPHLDVEPLPPAAIAEAAERGGIYDWATRDAGALRAARMEELFRWLAVDRQG